MHAVIPRPLVGPADHLPVVVESQRPRGRHVSGEHIFTEDIDLEPAADEARHHSELPTLELVVIPRGTDVIRQGEQARDFFILLDGEASVWIRDERSGEERQINRVVAGESFGEIGLLKGIPRTATVRLTTDSTYFTLTASAFQELLLAGDSGSLKLLQSLARGVARRQDATDARLATLMDQAEHPNGTVKLRVSAIREMLRERVEAEEAR